MIKQIIFDWKRTLYDPETQELIAGAVEVLEFVKNKNISLVLIGKGGDDMKDEVERLGVRKYFSEIVFAEGDKDPNIFASHISKYKPEDVIVIGDRVRSELEIGNKLGATTIWVKQGKFAEEKPLNQEQSPDYTSSSLKDCLKLISNLQ